MLNLPLILTTLSACCSVALVIPLNSIFASGNFIIVGWEVATTTNYVYGVALPIKQGNWELLIANCELLIA